MTFFDKLPLCFLLTSAIGWHRTGCFYCPTFPVSFPFSFVNALALLAPSCLLVFLSLLPSFLSSLNCMFSFYTAPSLALLPLPILLTFIPFSPPSCSLHPSYHFGSVRLIILHLLSTLETPWDYLLSQIHLFPSLFTFFLIISTRASSVYFHHTPSIAEKGKVWIIFLSPFSSPQPSLLLSLAFVHFFIRVLPLLCLNLFITSHFSNVSLSTFWTSFG